MEYSGMPNADPRALESPARLEALQETGLLDGPVDPSLERLTRLTRRVLGVPTAVVSLVDRNRQYFAAHSGLHEDLATARETSLDYSFCQHVVASAAPFVVTEATVHPLVSDNRAINEYGVHAYAGMPLRTSDGQVLGSFCAFDTEGRQWSQEDLDALQDLARAAMTEIELRSTLRLLEEQGAQLESLLESTREFVVRNAPDGTVRYANAAFRWAIGEPPEEPTPGWMRSRLDQESRARFDAAWAEARDRGHEMPVDLRFLPPGGAPVEVEGRLVPVVKRGTLRGIRFFGNDVTDARQIERAKDQLIGVVSHELRTPIGAVQGALQLLTRLLPSDLGEKPKELLALASRNAARLLALVNDLLDLERLEAGQLTMERRSVSIAEIFAIARDATAPLAEQRGVKLEWDPGELVVSADPDRLARVVINLVGNAVKFTPDGKRVTISAAQTAEDIVVRVHDEGRGIPPEAIDRIFERFTQVARSDAVEKGGSGLGLTIARAIVLAHGGRIWVESEMGQGSTFSFSLPLGAPTTRSSKALTQS
jgi:signal transduction histidine kinase